MTLHTLFLLAMAVVVLVVAPITRVLVLACVPEALKGRDAIAQADGLGIGQEMIA